MQEEAEGSAGQATQAGDQEAGRMGRVWIEVGDPDEGMLCLPGRRQEGSQTKRMWAGGEPRASGCLYLRTLVPPEGWPCWSLGIGS